MNIVFLAGQVRGQFGSQANSTSLRHKNRNTVSNLSGCPVLQKKIPSFKLVRFFGRHRIHSLLFAETEGAVARECWWVRQHRPVYGGGAHPVCCRGHQQQDTRHVSSNSPQCNALNSCSGRNALSLFSSMPTGHLLCCFPHLLARCHIKPILDNCTEATQLCCCWLWCGRFCSHQIFSVSQVLLLMRFRRMPLSSGLALRVSYPLLGGISRVKSTGADNLWSSSSVSANTSPKRGRQIGIWLATFPQRK